MKKSIILFSIAIFINMIFLLDVKAQNNNEFYLNYDNSTFASIKNDYDLDNMIDSYKTTCSSLFDDYVISLYKSSFVNYYNQMACIDVSYVDELRLPYKSGTGSGLYTMGNSMEIRSYNVDSSTHALAGLNGRWWISNLLEIDHTVSSPYYFFDNLNGSMIPVYSSKDLYINYYDNTDGKLYINNNYVNNGDNIYFYYNILELIPPAMLKINDSCTSPGLCESSSITITDNAFLNPFYKYKLEVYFDDTLFSTDEYTIFINKNLPHIYNDTTLKYKLYKADLSSNNYELVEEITYPIDLKYDSPEIIFYKEQYTEVMYTLHIYFFINDFNKEYTYQYKKNDEEYISSDDAFSIDLEEDSTIIARVLDKDNKVIMIKTYTNKLLDPNSPYADYNVSIYHNAMDFIVYVYNINNNYCDYKVNNGTWTNHNVCSTNFANGYAIYSNVFTENTKFSVRIFDSDHNLVFADTYYIKKDEYIVEPSNYKENINKFFNKYSNVIKEFQDLIQYTYDNLSEYIKIFLVSIWTMLLIVVTVRLIK